MIAKRAIGEAQAKLVDALVVAKAPPDMINAALDGRYDDYRSDVGDNIGQLVRDARAADLEAIAQRAIDGEFDGTKADSDEWAASPDGMAAFAALGGTT
jgi:hypothetical protein